MAMVLQDELHRVPPLRAFGEVDRDAARIAREAQRLAGGVACRVDRQVRGIESDGVGGRRRDDEARRHFAVDRVLREIEPDRDALVEQVEDARMLRPDTRWRVGADPAGWPLGGEHWGTQQQ
jgi:hypothetical protein